MRLSSIKTQLTIVLILIIMVLSGIGFYSAYRYFHILTESAEFRDTTDQTIVLSRSAQVHFKKQVQEWKNILLRGHSQADYKKHLRQFKIEEQNVSQIINQLLPMLNDIADAQLSAEQFQSAHLHIGKQYREALKLSNLLYSNLRVVDKKVRGIDRKPTNLLDEVVHSIGFYKASQLSRLDVSLAHKAYQSIIIGGMVVVLILYFLFQYINRFFTLPLYRATNIANRIADGNRDIPLELGDHDETRTLFNALNEMQSNLLTTENLLKHEIEEHKLAREQVERHTHYDALTNLPNRRMLMNGLDLCLAHSLRHQHTGALFILGLDHLKTINNSIGHEAGDSLIQQVAHRLRLNNRQENTVARLTGNEFAILLPTLNDPPLLPSKNAMSIANNLFALLSNPFQVASETLHITTSIGISLFPSDHEINTEDVLKQADIARHRAKNLGRNTACFFSKTLQMEADEHLKLQNDLRHALDNNDFFLHYQPQVDVSGRIIGAEALIRWQDSQRGPVSPAHFIPAAESTELILLIGEWVLR